MKNYQKKIKDYETICDELANFFCEKQELHFEGWVADSPGEIAYCGDLCFSLSDIIFDLKNNIKKGKIIEWLDCSKSFNYRSWIKLDGNV